MGPYHTLEELIGRKIVISDLLQTLSKIPRSDVLRCIAGLAALVERRDTEGLNPQIHLLRSAVPIELAEQIEASLKKRSEPFGTLFHRRQLWFVLQMSLLVCTNDSTASHDDETLREIGKCCLMANDLLKQVETVQSDIAPEDTKHSLSFLIAAFISYTELSLGSEVIARAQLFWLEIPDDESIQKLAKRIGLTKTLEQSFEDTYGLPLREFMRFIIVLYYKFIEPTIDDRPAVLMYDSTETFQYYFSGEHIEKSLQILSATPDALAARLLGTPRQSWATDTTALIRTPLIELAKNKYMCPDLHMFRAFFVQGIFELLMDVVNPGQLKQLLGGLFERYIERLMLNFAPESSILVNTYFSPVEFVSEKDQEACDGLLLWSSHAVLLECKSTMLTSRQRYAMSLDETTKAIDDQLATFTKPADKTQSERKSRKGIGQIAYNLSRILAGEQVHNKRRPIDLSGVAKFYPAVVIYDEGMSNHGVRLHLQNKMIEWFEEWQIDHSRIGHVLLFTIRDMEYFEMLAQKLGAENVMKDYVAYVEENPRDPHSMFHEYVLNRYKEAGEPSGITNETTERILKTVQEEMKQRKTNRSGSQIRIPSVDNS